VDHISHQHFKIVGTIVSKVKALTNCWNYCIKGKSFNFGCAGDDCIGILEGTSNLAIEKVTCGPGHGIR
jgi:hypothetical protein